MHILPNSQRALNWNLCYWQTKHQNFLLLIPHVPCVYWEHDQNFWINISHKRNFFCHLGSLTMLNQGFFINSLAAKRPGPLMKKQAHSPGIITVLLRLQRRLLPKAWMKTTGVCQAHSPGIITVLLSLLRRLVPKAWIKTHWSLSWCPSDSGDI